MKKYFTAAMISGFAAFMCSCGTSRSAASLSAIDGEWDVIEINGSSLKHAEGQDAPFIGFNSSEKRVYGSAGCNRLTGGFNADAKTGKIDLGGMGSTRMMCPDMTTEDAMLEAIGKVASYKIKADGTMTFDNTSGKTLIVLKKRQK